MYYEQLRDRLYAVVPYPWQLANAIQHRMKAWRNFCQLPPEVKVAFARAASSGVDEGYFLRSRANGREDKEYFHFTGSTLDWACSVVVPQVGSSSDHARNMLAVWQFLTYADEIHRDLTTLTIEMAADFEGFAAGVLAQVRRPDVRRVIRFLHYNPQDPNDMSLADPHFDRGGFTLHLYESHPGLQYMDWDGTWKPAPLQEGQTVVLTGYGLDALSKGDVQRTWHRVVRDKDALGEDDRYSAVMFVDFSSEYEYRTHDSRTQDETPGYRARQS